MVDSRTNSTSVNTAEPVNTDPDRLDADLGTGTEKEAVFRSRELVPNAWATLATVMTYICLSPTAVPNAPDMRGRDRQGVAGPPLDNAKLGSAITRFLAKTSTR